MNIKSLATGLSALCLALVTLMGVGTAGAASQYTAWDNDGNSYVSSLSQAAANAAATAWNTSHHYSAVWSGFVVFGASQASANQLARDLKGNSVGGSFWIATSQSGAVFTSYVSQADVQAKAAADLNPSSAPAYTATSSRGITYTSAVSQANANAMATFVEFAAVPHYFFPGLNGTTVESAVSFVDAVSQAGAQAQANPYSAGAGDYIGYDASSGETNPADMIVFSAPTQAQANALALAWGTALVHGGLWLATSPAASSYAFISTTSQAAATAEAGSYSGFFPGIATLDAAGPDSHSLSATNVTFYSFFQQFADNMAAYTYYKPGPLPTVPEVCYQGAKSNSIALLSWQCPAHWTMLKAAQVAKHALTPRCPGGGRLSGAACQVTTGLPATVNSCPFAGVLSGTMCVSTVNEPVTPYTPGTSLYCPSGGILSGATCTLAWSYVSAHLTTITCARGKTKRAVRGVSPRCPAGWKKR
jgi:hypothetical protein